MKKQWSDIIKVMRYNKKVGDEIFNPKTTIHPSSWFATFGKRIENFTDEELLQVVSGTAHKSGKMGKIIGIERIKNFKELR